MCSTSFYQHIEGTADWDWRITWAHASSPDLVRWKHEPIALVPTKDSLDAAGVWSGTCTIDEDGVPTILHTAVR